MNREKTKIPRHRRVVLHSFCIVCALMFLATNFLLELGKDEQAISYPVHPTIAIDAGHGGIDRGASGYGIFEADINLAIAKEVQTTLSCLGYSVCMTRTGDYGLYGDTSRGFKSRDMKERKNIVESSSAMCLVSIHQNAWSDSTRSGAIVYCNTKKEKSLALATAIGTMLNCPVKGGDYYITNQIKTPAVIVECGFISTKSEAEKLATKEYQERIATEIARGVLMFLQGEGV